VEEASAGHHGDLLVQLRGQENGIDRFRDLGVAHAFPRPEIGHVLLLLTARVISFYPNG
jgi:hypothetical protein